MTKNSFLVLLLVLILVPIGAHSTPTHAQDSDSISKVYFTTMVPNYAPGQLGDSAEDIIWELDTATGTTRELLRIEPYRDDTPRETFSENELQRLEGAWGADSLDSSLFQGLEAVALLDVERLLIVTSNETRSGRNGFQFFGFYKFQILNVLDGNLITVTTVDYHPMLLGEEWGCVDQGRLGDVRSNPTIDDLFAFSFVPLDPRWCSSYYLGYTFLVNASILPAQVEIIPYAREFSWSPDGSMIAYAGSQPCTHQGDPCRMIYSVRPTPRGSTPTVFGYGRTSQNDPRPLITWLDSHTIVYQYSDPTQGDPPDSLAAYDITSERIIFSTDFYRDGLHDLGYLDDGQTHLVYGTNPAGTLFLYYTPEGELVQRQTSLRVPIDSRSRLNAASFLGWSMSPLMRRSDRMISRLDLSPYIPAGHSLRFIAN